MPDKFLGPLASRTDERVSLFPRVGGEVPPTKRIGRRAHLWTSVHATRTTEGCAHAAGKERERFPLQRGTDPRSWIRVFALSTNTLHVYRSARGQRML